MSQNPEKKTRHKFYFGANILRSLRPMRMAPCIGTGLVCAPLPLMILAAHCLLLPVISDITAAHSCAFLVHPPLAPETRASPSPLPAAGRSDDSRPAPHRPTRPCAQPRRQRACTTEFQPCRSTLPDSLIDAPVNLHVLRLRGGFKAKWGEKFISGLGSKRVRLCAAYLIVLFECNLDREREHV